MKNPYLILFLIFSSLLIGTSGCILPFEGSRQITILPQNRITAYEQQFDEAYAAPSPDGGYDLVLTYAMHSGSLHVGRRLYASTPTGQPQQIIHIHVAWRTGRGKSSEHPAASNSDIDWYILTGENQRIVYSGRGFIAVETGATSSLFDLRDVTIEADEITPGANDALGPSRLTGEIRAKNDASRVRQILAQLQEIQNPQ